MGTLKETAKNILSGIFDLVRADPGVTAYHGTFNPDMLQTKKFYPLSHFGSQAAAEERVDIMETKKRELGRYGIMEVQLKIKNPLELKDPGGGHGLGTWKYIFSLNLLGQRDYSIKMDQFMSQEEMNYIFEDTKNLTLEQALSELKKDTIYDSKNPPDANGGCGTFDKGELQNAKSCVTAQRMIQVIERKGYDGISYRNDHEDKGHTSYIVFRPEKQIKVVKTTIYDTSAPKIENEASPNGTVT